jgi:drug/metabolite transporter (DMT)-like permease
VGDYLGNVTSHKKTAGFAWILLSTATAGLATVLGKWNLHYISPLLMNTLIFSVGGTLLISYTIVSRGVYGTFTLSARGWRWVGLFSLSSLFAVFAIWTGVQKMDPSLAAFLNRSEVLVSIILAMILLGERFNRIETVGALLSLSGIFIMRFTLREDYSDGFWWVLVGSLFFGVTEYVSKRAVTRVPPTVLAAIRNCLMAIVFWLVFLLAENDWSGIDTVWPGVVALGIAGPIISRLAYLKALEQLELTKVAVISQGQPVVVLLIALVALSQLPTVRESIGGVFLVAGCTIMILGRRGITIERKSVVAKI